MARIVVGISGASGIILGIKTLKELVAHGHEIECVITKEGLYTAGLEVGKQFASPARFLLLFTKEEQSKIRFHSATDMAACIASGSYPVDGMVVVPCSMATIAAVAMGLGDNVLRRAVDVSIKERRRLVLVPREAPLSSLHLENLLKLSRLGAIILPPVAAWYLKPKTLDDVERYIVGKVFEGLGLPHTLYSPWTGLP